MAEKYSVMITVFFIVSIPIISPSNSKFRRNKKKNTKVRRKKKKMFR